MGRHLRGRRKTNHGRDTTPSFSCSECDGVSSEFSSAPVGPPECPTNPANSAFQRDRLRLQPITSFSSFSGLANVIPPSGMAAGTGGASVINNSTIIEILVRLLCCEREPDNNRRELLFQALCKVIKQWNNSLYVPLHSFAEPHEFHNCVLKKFELLLGQLQNQIVSKTPTSLQLPSQSGSPLTQLALTNSYQYHFREDRYSRDFKEISLLGKGGFGSVVKAESRLDGRAYAIKIIIMDKKDNETNQKILREVQALAQLEHPNIVRYHTTWLQLYNVPPQHLPEGFSQREFRKPRHPVEKVGINVYPPSNVKIQELSSLSEPDDTEDSSSSIVFMDLSRSKVDMRSSQVASKNFSVCHTIDETGESSFDSRVSNSIMKNGVVGCRESRQGKDYLKLNVSSAHIVHTEKETVNSHLLSTMSYSLLRKDVASSQISFPSDSEEKGVYSSTSSSAECSLMNSLLLYQKQPREPQMTLFIQMGLCGQTLADWIMERNTLCKLWLDDSDIKRSLTFFKEILIAVQYIHSKKIVHRDLKPPNIFLTDGKHLQIGDFGLARPMQDPVDLEMDETGAVSNCFSVATVSKNTTNTGGVGTPIYAPPEIKFGRFYGNKSDMHNLGIILLELVQPFQTRSEKYDKINKLKTRRFLDPELHHRWPDIASWILMLTDHNEKNRPTAAEFLKLMSGCELLKIHSDIDIQMGNHVSSFSFSNVKEELRVSDPKIDNEIERSLVHLNTEFCDLDISETENVASNCFSPEDEKIPDLESLDRSLNDNQDKNREMEILREEKYKAIELLKEKDRELEMLREKDKVIAILREEEYKELKVLREKDKEIALLKEEKDKEIEMLKMKNKEIAILREEKDKEIAMLKGENDRALEMLLEKKDKEIAMLKGEKGKEIEMLLETNRKLRDMVAQLKEHINQS